MINKSEPPKCPSCGKGLWTVGVRKMSLLMFDREKNGYITDDSQLEVFCPECDADVYDVLPEAVRGRWASPQT